MAMNKAQPTSSVVPAQATARTKIKIRERADGGKEFIQPATRNFREKMQSTAFLAVALGIFVGILFMAREFMDGLPYAWARFLVANMFFIPVAVFGLCAGVLAIACGDIWLRSNHVVVSGGRLQLLTRWAFVTRKVDVPVEKIIQMKVAHNTTINDASYFGIEVRTTGDNPSWFYRYFPPKKQLGEIELKRIQTGGKVIRAMTEIEGYDDADWILSELRSALGINV
jgi:hypothetical protein